MGMKTLWEAPPSSKLNIERAYDDTVFVYCWEADPVPVHPPETPLEMALMAAAEAGRGIELNPGAALQRAIREDRLLPAGSEFTLESDGTVYHAQLAEYGGLGGEVRVYYCEAGQWDEVKRVRAGYS